MAISHHIQNLRAKPEHVRERIAFMSSAGITGVVAAVWVVTLATTGTFSLSPKNAGVLAQVNTQTTVDQTKNNFTQLVGAAGVALGATSTQPASLRIVDGGSTSSLDQKRAASANNSSATVIPF